MWIRRAIALTFWVSCALLIAGYFHLIDTPAFAPQIPKDFHVAGPWAYYSLGVVRSPVGGISYHHAYPAIQILVLAATYLSLLRSTRVWLPTLILSSLWMCSFVSGSRAGFVAASAFVVAVVASRPRQLLAVAAVALVTVAIYAYFSDDFAGEFSRAQIRQESITTSYEDDGLAGRVEIWNDRVGLLNRNPPFWLIGTGFGSAIESGSNGHMLYLQTTLECGLVGTSLFLFLMWKIMQSLWRQGSGGRIMCYLTIALLASAITQETFYPVPALGHFGGMFLFCAGTALCAPRFCGAELRTP